MQCFKKYLFTLPGSSPVASHVQKRAPCGNCPANVEMPVKLVEVVKTGGFKDCGAQGRKHSGVLA